jgi:hypothetical protein
MENIIKALAEWGRVAHGKEREFLDEFCHGAWILTQATWDSENMRFVYILDSGQHIADSVKMEKWLDFYNKYK